MRLPALVITLVLLTAGWASAQQVRLEFKDGNVTLRAENAPIRTILAEWSRRGSTQIINGDRVTGSPVTLELTNVPERQALDVLLRGVAGFMIGRREGEAATSDGRSTFDRIHILPTAAPTRAATPVTPLQPPRMPTPFRAAPPVPDDVPIEAGIVDDVPEEEEPAASRVARPLPAQRDQDADADDDAPEPGAATRGNPFGAITGTSRPGVITPFESEDVNTPSDRARPTDQRER